MEKLILISNPGSASRKYSLFAGGKKVAGVHYEYEEGKIVYSCDINGEKSSPAYAGISHLTFAASNLGGVMESRGINMPKAAVAVIGVRIVAPSSYFQLDRALNKSVVAKLEQVAHLAPLHTNASLQEIHILSKAFPEAKIVGLSDSAFHVGLPDWSGRYALPSSASQKLDIKRFGYHGLSLESVVRQLQKKKRLPARLIVAHLGSGASVTAIKNGRSLDCSMGYSPLEGLMMSTRSGSLDVTASEVLADELKLSDLKLQDFLNNKSGLLGVSGYSDDIRELLKVESKNSEAKLALKMYVKRAQGFIGQMAGVLGGVDALVFTGTVGERSNVARQRIVSGLLFLGLDIDPAKNHRFVEPGEIIQISPKSNPAKVLIVPADEDRVMLEKSTKLAGE